MEAAIKYRETGLSTYARHPSLGQPGSVVIFRAASLLPAPTQPVQAKQSSEAQACTSADVTVKIPPASVPLIFAHRQWRAGMLLADAIAADEGPFSIANETVLELGAGTALPGIVAARKGTAQFVVITDYNEAQLVEALIANVRQNVCSSTLQRRGVGGARVLGYTWGHDTEDLTDVLPSESPCLFTRILLADCIWDLLSHRPLINTITRTLQKVTTARVLVVAGLHTGRDTLWAFIRRAGRCGLKVMSVVDPCADGASAWPHLSDEENDEGMATMLDASDPLYRAEDHILELELAEESPFSPDKKVSSMSDDNQLEAISCRLTGRRRRFATISRPEETLMDGDRVHADSVRERNRWITVYSLGWEPSKCK